jgi:hypothetical protein
MKLHFSSPRWTTCSRALGKKRGTMPGTGQRRISQPALTLAAGPSWLLTPSFH